ncbi:MAG: Gfo/Idh/MocA family oxidoreductase [Bacteroidales bacterium]
MKKSGISRRSFLGTAAAAGAAGIVVPTLLTSCAPKHKNVVLPVMLEKAPDGPLLKAGLIGCGGRGTGAAINFIHAGPNLTISALGDVFTDRITSCRERLAEDGVQIADENCFTGFDAYQKVIESGVDIIILATPPVFRPEHVEAAVSAGKHVFMEKPVAVDPVGARQILASGEKAKGMELSIVTGTQRHHQHDYVATWGKIQEGMIGDIVSANCYWNQGQLWYREPNPSWTEMEYMIRDWVNWSWLSGDHIVEQHVHNIDVISWFTGKRPVSAVSFGSRQRRPTGDQYDFFSTDFVYEGGIHVHSMCRQINGCESNVSEWIQGTKGTSNCQNTVWDKAGTQLWKYDGYKLDEAGKMTEDLAISPYDQEHIDFVTAIRTGKPLNEAEFVAYSTMAGIMGRVSAYTGKLVTWDEMMNSELKLGPKVYAMGPVDVPKTVPVPGE